ILSYNTWQRYFGADRGIVGRSIPLDGEAHEVVGVMGPDFEFPDLHTDFWLPLVWPGSPRPARLLPTARLRDGVSIEAAARELNEIMREVRHVDPNAPRFELPPEAPRGWVLF